MSRRFHGPFLVLAALLGLAAGDQANAAVLDFATTIDQSYGDIPGVLDVSHNTLATGGGTGPLAWWDAGYDELRGVAWASNIAAGLRAQMRLVPLDGQHAVQLQSLQLGSWEAAGAGRVETLNIYRIGDSVPAFSFTGLIGLNNLSTTFSPDLSSTTGLLIEWTNPWWTAIDNVSYQLPSAVPEPGAGLLMMAGLGLFCCRRLQAAATQRSTT